MNDNARNQIKAYLIRIDLQSEDDLRAAEAAFRLRKCKYTAEALLACMIRREAYNKVLSDLWALLTECP